MQTYGKLTIRMYVLITKPDTHTRARGSWRTLMTKWIDREEVEHALLTFTEANPELHAIKRQLDIKFDTSEDIVSW